MSANPGFTKTALSVAVGVVLLSACARQVSREEMAKATEGYIEDTNKLFVVDCLLPGQVRKLGAQMTYLSARRPIRTTAADCEVRGGEYVAYDRANYASAFKVWLPKAQEGDAEAQNYVGQVYEKGLGQPADYPSALEWYRKSAVQGNAQAQLNLGHMYEKGLGTAADQKQADYWYRKASGLDAAGLQFTPAATVFQPTSASAPADNAAEVEALRREAEASRAEAEKSRQEAAQLRAKLQEAEQRVIDQQDALRRSQDEVTEARQKLSAAPSQADDAATRQLQAELRQKEEQLKAQQERLAAMTGSLNEVEALRQQAEQSRQEAGQLRGQLSEAQRQLAGEKDALRAMRDDMEETRRKLQQEKSAPAKADDTAQRQLEQELRQKQAQLKAQEAKMASMAASLEKERQSVQREREGLQRQKAAAPVGDGGLAQTQAELNEKINAYQKKSAELTEWLTGGAADRGKIDARKKELQADAKAIAALREQLGQQKLADSGAATPSGGPAIEIIDPPVTLTRGMPSIQISGGTRKEIVGRIRAADGLGSLLVNEQPQPVDASGLFRVPFTGEQAQIKIVATDKKNRRADLNVSLVGETAGATQAEAFTPSKASAGTRPTDVDFGQFYALIIGNADYKAYPGLKTPINDAKSVELILRERYGFKTKLLLNANRHDIMSALNEMNKRLTDKDNLLIYYAGHGEIDKATQNAYWLPTDAEVGNPANWISSQSITEYLGIMPARHIMVVADSCYSGALTGSAVAKLPEGMDESKRDKWLKVMNSRKARTVLTSGGVKPVLDEGGGEHSVFANAFLKVLRGGGKQVVEDYEVFRDVSNQVRGAAARLGFQQTPQYAPLQHAGHEGSPFFFVPEA